ncbi:carbohydrate ABC transporter permease [Jiangella alba]|uniref:Carbohydrate ABC transporter membrane protein 2, CUT1 family n=1 Tax=Jiangella alba TaxID=561176 RepID=A0A1H5JBA5_9ACTN|nr:carbohydrate ABC transporter permease [Jiangella alba]SEE49710.1 carbohydrate ABC transporter membrane protein 2, CUT1 family [Jiangella alba]
MSSVSSTVVSRRRSSKRQSNTGAYIVLSIAAFVMAFPFVWQLIMSLSTEQEVTSVPPTFWPARLQFDNYTEVFDTIPFLNQLGVSIAYTALRVTGQVVLCSLAGYAFARMRFAAKGILLGLILSILMVPSQVYLIPQFQLVQGLGLLNTVWGIALPGVFSAFGVFLMRQFFMNLPVELEEAARLDGANPFQVFWRIMLPLAGPAISALVILTTLASWNDLLWPLVVTTFAERMPLAVGLATMQGTYQTDYTLMMATSVLAMAPVLILFVILQRRVVAGLAFTGTKG